MWLDFQKDKRMKTNKSLYFKQSENLKIKKRYCYYSIIKN